MKKNKQVTLKTIKDSYYPIKVYKSLVKISYCLLDERELSKFQFAHQLLMSNNDEEFRGLPFIRLFSYFLTNGSNFKKPSAVLFKRRLNPDSLLVPEKTLVLRFANLTYQIFILSDKDLELLKLGRTFTCLPFPVSTNKYQFAQTDLSVPEKKCGEKLDFTFSFKSMKKVF